MNESKAAGSIPAAVSLLIVAATFAGCQSYVDSTPAKLLEGDPANYTRVFREPLPAGVTVVNSAVVTYSFRPGVVTTDDFEFELLVPRQWIQQEAKRHFLRKHDGEIVENDLAGRREQARPWYAPKPLDQYELYRDVTSVGYVHMMVQKEEEADGRRRVFVSKH